MNQGWICPVCRRGVRPDMTTCDHSSGHQLGHQFGWPQIAPAWPQHPTRTGDPMTPPYVVTYGGIGATTNPQEFTN